MLNQKIAAIEATRAKSDPLPSGEAPYTTSDMFKTLPSINKPKAKRWDHRLSLESRNRIPSTLKESGKILNNPNMIPLGTARPSPEHFPWESATFHAIAPPFAEPGISPRTEARNSNRQGDTFDLNVALAYGYAAGSPQLIRFVTEHVEMIHNPPYADWESCLTCGSTSAMEMALRIFCNHGDYMLTEEYTYSGTVECARPLGVKVQGVKMDDLGLIPESLDSILSSWDITRGPKPFLLYTVPSGHNPTGTTQPTCRRQAIYEVAERHDLYIIEDDPYYILSLQTNRTAPTPASLTNDEYLASLPPSYLSLDRSGRVLRLDSTAKSIAPGLRCAWMAGSSQIIERFINHIELSTIAPSGVSQLMLYKLLEETWGHNGFIAWLANLSFQYSNRCRIVLEACDRYLPHEYCQWSIPSSGMFVWLRVDWRKHPAVGTGVASAIAEIEDRIFTRAIDNGVLVSKGSWFRAEKAEITEICFRLTFAAAKEADLDEAIKRFADAVKFEFGCQQ